MDDIIDLPDDVASTFGYHPNTRLIDAVVDQGNFTRALVVDAQVGGVADVVRHCRVLWNSRADLPGGVYWFSGLVGGDLVMQMSSGALPSDLSIIPNAAIDESNPLYAAWSWGEHLWAQGDDVPAPKYAVHDAVMTDPGGLDVIVQDRKFVREQWFYTVLLDGTRQQVSESGLQPCPVRDDPTQWVTEQPTPASRFSATLTRAKLKGRFSDTLFSFRSTRTTFRPYQFKPVLKFLQTGRARLLIADEVGLGKTIEAGLIWTELEARQESDRVLVVCPSSLVGKWREEMISRFGFDLIELTREELTTFLTRHLQNRLPRRAAYVCSIERLRTWTGLRNLHDAPPTFDLIVVDEAHSMRNQDTKSYALGTQMAEWATNLVFLSATPINLGQQDLQSLLELLAPEDFGDIRDLELRLEPNKYINRALHALRSVDVDPRSIATQLEGLGSTVYGAPLMRRPEMSTIRSILDRNDLTPREIITLKRELAELNTLSSVITRTKKVEVDDRRAKRTERRYDVSWTAVERNFYQEYVEWCDKRARELGSNLYFAMQMPLRLASACLPMARQKVLNPRGPIVVDDSDEGQDILPPHQALIDAARELGDNVDSKFDQLRSSLALLREQGKQGLVFTFSRPTLHYLQDRLRSDFRITLMHGGVSRDERHRIMVDFRDGRYDFVLANRVASEGLDFEFCSAVINYDLPWNPMELEQRIGRIDRIGQTEDTIHIVNFVNDDTIDEKILDKLIKRIDIFESSIGSLEPIISEHASSILQVGFDFSLSAKEREEKVEQAIRVLEEHRAGLRDVSDAASSLLVIDDVDIAGLEDELAMTGRYVGQRELALLLDDWAHTDGAAGVTFSRDGQKAEFRGNATMARRVTKLTEGARRTRAEVDAVASKLRDEMTIPLVLDQELARTRGGMLLAAANPLVMAATTVPVHRQARFAAVRVQRRDEQVPCGMYVVVLVHAIGASQGGDEIWGSAIGLQGNDAGTGPVHALLAALAEGALVDCDMPDVAHLPQLAERAVNILALRHDDEQGRRQEDFQARQAVRQATLEQQHSRKMQAIERRIDTARSNRRDAHIVALFESQRTKTQQRYERLTEELAHKTPPMIRVEPLAACLISLVEG